MKTLTLLSISMFLATAVSCLTGCGGGSNGTAPNLGVQQQAQTCQTVSGINTCANGQFPVGVTGQQGCAAGSVYLPGNGTCGYPVQCGQPGAVNMGGQCYQPTQSGYNGYNNGFNTGNYYANQYYYTAFPYQMYPGAQYGCPYYYSPTLNGCVYTGGSGTGSYWWFRSF